MAELLEENKKLSRAEQLALAKQIMALADEEFKAELVRRAQGILKNPSAGYSLEEVEAHLLAQDEVSVA